MSSHWHLSEEAINAISVYISWLLIFLQKKKGGHTKEGKRKRNQQIFTTAFSEKYQQKLGYIGLNKLCKLE